MPHTYVIHTMAGNEDKIVTLLQRSGIVKTTGPEKNAISNTSKISENIGGIATPTQELLFIPTVTFQISKRNKETGDKIVMPDTRKVYPGYVFLSTDRPDDFRMRISDFWSIFGQHLKVLTTTPKMKKDNDWFQNYSAELSEAEEESVLGLCGMERAADGSIVKTSPAERERIEKTADPFNIGMSIGVKYVKKGSLPGKRKEGDIRIVITEGPLAGREADIVYIDRHKKFATLRTAFLGRKVDVRVPCQIVDVIEE